jgi:NADH:quinone reductase (non-electrogenic)
MPGDRVVIVGAGFGGLAAARALKDQDVDVLVVDRNNFHTFQPLLYQVATAGLDPDDIAYNVRAILRRQANAGFRMATVLGVDWRSQRLLVDRGDPIDFDVLVIAAGATTDSFGVPGVDEHAFALKTLADSALLRSHLLSQFERADTDARAIDAGALTFAIVGGGPTGVELSGALSELVRHVLARDFPRLDVDRTRIVLIEATDHLLGAFSPQSQRHARKTLVSRGVEVLLETTVEQVTPDAVQLPGGRTLPACTVVWAAGVRAAPLAGALGLEQTRGGRVVVDADLRVPGRPEVFVIGDMAGAPAPGGGLQPQLAPVAIQQARHVAAQIDAVRRGSPTAPFEYHDPGTMATIGRNAAVAELGRFRFRGFLAWVMWLVLHLVQLIGFRNRASVLLDWAWNYVTYDRSARIIEMELLERRFPSALR